MSAPDREIPQRELRNEVSRVLREVQAGLHLRVTVHGQPVADLVPVSGETRYISRADVERILRTAPLDPAFSDDVDGILDETVDELETG